MSSMRSEVYVFAQRTRRRFLFVESIKAVVSRIVGRTKTQVKMAKPHDTRNERSGLPPRWDTSVFRQPKKVVFTSPSGYG